MKRVIHKEIVSPNWYTKMLESESKIINRPTRTAKKQYDKLFVYLPTDLVKDSAFPFVADEKIKIKIDKENNRLLIEKTQ